MLDDVGVTTHGSGATAITNAGLFEKACGIGVSYIDGALTNTGALRFGLGWWAVEPADGRRRRWTDGDAALALPPGASTVEIETVRAMPAEHEALRRAA